MNKITEIIPNNLPKHLQDAMDEGQFFNYVVNNMVPKSQLEELIEKSYFTVYVTEGEIDTVITVDDLRQFIIDHTILAKAKQ